MSRDRQLKLLFAIEEQNARARRFPLKFYKPHPRQVAFHRLSQEKRVTIWTAGNRSGKSVAGSREARALSLGYRPWEVPDLQPTAQGTYPPRSEIDPKHWLLRPDGLPLRVPNVGLVLSGLSFAKGINKIAFPALESCLTPADRRHPAYKVTRSSQGYPLEMVLPEGGQIIFGSGQQEAKDFEGIAVDWVWADEPFPHAFWIPIWRSLTDTLGRIFFTMTAVTNDAPWVKQELVDTGRDDVGHMSGSIYDNPYITSRARDELINAQMTEEERQARVHGGWAFMTHRAFPAWDPAVHIIAPFRIPVNWPRTCVVDPAHRRPYAIAWLAWGPDGEVFINDEWPAEEHHLMRSSPYDVKAYSAKIFEKEGPHRSNVYVLDPRFGKAKFILHGEEDAPLVEKFEEYGLYFETDVPGTDREETGIALMRDMLAWDTREPLSPVNRPKLFVFSHCRNSILMFENSNFLPPHARDNQILPEGLRETFKDFRDAIRYGILAGRPVLGTELTESYIPDADLEQANDPRTD